MRKCFWYGGAAIVALLSASAAQAGTLWIANLNNANEPVGTARTNATGIGSLVLNDAATSATVRVTHNEATANPSPVTLGHIHRGPAGVNGPVTFPFPNPNSPVGPLTWAIPAAEVTNLRANGLYVNIHTQQNTGGDIRGQLVRALLETSATTAYQRTVAAALDVSAGYSAELDVALIDANTRTGTARTQALDELGGGSVYINTQEAIEAMGDFANAALSQAGKHRALGAEGDTGFSLFAQAGSTFGTRKARDGATGAKISRPMLVGGLNYAMEDMSVGLALGYAHGKNTLKDSLGKTTGKTFAIEGYVSSDFGGSGVVADATIGWGWTSYDISRTIPSFARTATGDTKGTSWGGAIRVAVPLEAGGGFDVSPYVQLDMVEAKVDGYTEGGAGALGLNVTDVSVANGYSELGIAIGPESASEGSIVPRAHVGWRHALNNGSGSVSTRLVGSTIPFFTPMLPSRDGVSLGASIATRLSSGVELNLDYRGLVANPRVNSHSITAGVRFRF